MSLRFFLGPDWATLAKRYAFVTAARLVWVTINDLSGSLSVVFPVPYYWRLFGLVGIVDIVLAFLQLGIAFGLVRIAVRHFRPDLIAQWRILDDALLSKKAGKDAGQSSFGTTVLLSALVVFTCCFLTWYVLGANGSGYNHTGFVQFVFSRDAGGISLLVGIALAVLGMAYGAGFVAKAKSKVGGLFGVKYLEPGHWLAQRVAAKAKALGLPPPAVGIINVNNAFAIGTRDDAAVVIGVPLTKSLSAEELDAVIGHELGHILSNDMYRMQFAEGFQTMLGHVLGVITTVGVRIAARHDRNAALLGNSLGTLARHTVFVGSELVVKGISRSREFYADAIGASVTSPEAMIGALERLHNLPAKPTRLESQYGYLMFRGSKLGVMFSTHPTLERRIKALKAGTHLPSRTP